jgi:hypothetical protein
MRLGEEIIKSCKDIGHRRRSYPRKETRSCDRNDKLYQLIFSLLLEEYYKEAEKIKEDF